MRKLSVAPGIGLAALSVVVVTALSRRAPADAPPPDPSAIPTAAPSEAPVAPPAAPLPPPSAFDDDAAMAKHADPVASYTLTATLDPAAHTLKGEGQIRWKNASTAPTSELWIHLYLNAFKNERTVFLRAPTYGFRGAGEPGSWGWIDVTRFFVREMDADVWANADKTSPGDPADETDIRIPLPRAVEPGDSITIDMAWDEKLPEILLRTGYEKSFHMVGQWFPKIARREDDGTWAHFPFDHLTEFYSDFGSYDVTIDTPEAFTVGAVGKLVDEKREGGRARRRFKEDDVHDFSFAAWDEFVERTTAHDGVSIRCLYPKGDDAAAETEINAVGFALDRFGKLFGRYPYDHLTLVHPPEDAEEAGGMEYPTLITTGGPWWLPASGVHVIETVAVHELGHEWFYGLVATDEHRFSFLDEGINSYAELDAMEALFPNASMTDAFGLKIGMPSAYRALGSQVEQNGPVVQSTTRFATGGDYGALVYERGATILLTLGRVYGEDAMRRAVGRYARRYRFAHPTPDDFIAVIRETLGDDAAEALHAALFDRATVDYVLDGLTSHEVEEAHGIFGDPKKPNKNDPAPAKTTWRGEVLVRRRGALRFPVDVELYAADGTRTRTHWEAREPFIRIPYEGASELVGAVVDPEHRVLLDDDLGNNARSRSGMSFSKRAFETVLFDAELNLSGALP